MIPLAFENGIGFLKYYTNDSNLLALAGGILFAIAGIRCLKNGEAGIPVWVRIIRYLATVCLTVTFLVVVFALAPSGEKGGYREMLLEGSMLYVHFLCPVLSLISFLLFENYSDVRPSFFLLSAIPTVLYALVSVPLNICRVWTGPYFFLLVYEQSVFESVLWGIGLIAGTLIIGWLLLWGNRKIQSMWDRHVPDEER